MHGLVSTIHYQLYCRLCSYLHWRSFDQLHGLLERVEVDAMDRYKSSGNVAIDERMALAARWTLDTGRSTQHAARKEIIQ